jgi:hypothetical protein
MAKYAPPEKKAVYQKVSDAFGAAADAFGAAHSKTTAFLALMASHENDPPEKKLKDAKEAGTAIAKGMEAIAQAEEALATAMSAAAID